MSYRKCVSPNHPDGAPPKNLWQCRGCGRWTCASCEGGADDLPHHCDVCWSQLTKRVATYNKERN